jgi:AraC family transcriptional regulator
MLEPSIEYIKSKKLVGIKMSMSLAADKTPALFRQFMPRQKEIHQGLNFKIYELVTYPPEYFTSLDLHRTFEKWVAREVKEYELIPESMETFDLIEGQYARFDYKGLSSDKSIYQYIYSQWFPKSEYYLDSRPHFNILSGKTKLNDPNSEEEIWIPITTTKHN